MQMCKFTSLWNDPKMLFTLRGSLYGPLTIINSEK